MKSKRASPKKLVSRKPVTRKVTKTKKSSTAKPKTAAKATKKLGNVEILVLCGPADAAPVFLSQLKKIRVETPTKGSIVVYRDVCPEKLTQADVVTACATAGLEKDKFDIIVTTACRHTDAKFWPNVAALLKKGGIAIGPVMGNQWRAVASSQDEQDVLQELFDQYALKVTPDKSDLRLINAEKVMEGFSASKRAVVLALRSKIADTVTAAAPSLKMLPLNFSSIAAYQKA